nr:U3 small nucleolar ribonucleoprotein protein IMP4-like isoform X2 [Ziziphus jujuba var. spinosa]
MLLRRNIWLRRKYLYSKNAWKENATLLFDKEEQNQRNPFKELKFDFPNAQQMNQAGGGKGLFLEIIEICCTCDFTDVVLVHEHRGVPARLIISHLPFGPTACFHLLNAVTRHDI